jgi:hypothetical protein
MTDPKTGSSGSLVPLPAAAALPALPFHLDRTPVRSLRRWLANGRPQAVLSLPFIYGMALPLLLLDLSFALYQATSFPLYGIAKVRRRDYFVLDRARLPYLNPIEKVHCFYCSYANGLIAYVREITARTEQYWCPIKHEREPVGAHDRYGGFIEYGNAGDFAARSQELRRRLAEAGGKADASRPAPAHATIPPRFRARAGS